MKRSPDCSKVAFLDSSWPLRFFFGNCQNSIWVPFSHRRTCPAVFLGLATGDPAGILKTFSHAAHHQMNRIDTSVWLSGSRIKWHLESARLPRLLPGSNSLLKCSNDIVGDFDMEQWMFPTEDGTPIFYTNFLRRVWYKVQDAAKVRRRTPHDPQLGESYALGWRRLSLCLLAAGAC